MNRAPMADDGRRSGDARGLRHHRKICPPSSVACRLVIATHNSGKLKEMRELLAPYRIEAISAGDMGLSEPEETGTTFRANARLKAEAA